MTQHIQQQQKLHVKTKQKVKSNASKVMVKQYNLMTSVKQIVGYRY